MCGIYACFHHGRHKITDQHTCIKRRGPDDTKHVIGGLFDMVFYRLSVVGVSDGMQPFQHQCVSYMCNGEIYNHKELEMEHKISVDTQSDCEVIGLLYQRYGVVKTLRLIRGEFAFVIYDEKRKLVHFARDYMGRKGLYYGVEQTAEGKIESLEVSSLIGGLSKRVKGYHVLPQYVYTYDMEHKTMTKMRYMSLASVPMTTGKWEHIYERLELAVKDRVVQCERPIGFLLSGGLDSSIILSLAMKMGLVKKPHVFTFGFEQNAPDVKAAKIVVEHLKKTYGDDSLEWHLVIQPVEAGLVALPSVINALETYDTTTVRASTPMYLISKYISKNTDVRVIISGEGADELFGGYLYNMYAPNEEAFKADVVQSLENLYLYDCLRADRVTAYWGLEVRCPFLDIRLVEYVVGCNRLKKPVHTTKELLRHTVKTKNLLPDEIVWGKKEAFSDAVGLSWMETVARHSDAMVKHECDSKDVYSSHIKPQSNTEKLFQILFGGLFNNYWHVLPKYWMPNQEWVNTGGESSARALSVYNTIKTGNTTK